MDTGEQLRHIEVPEDRPLKAWRVWRLGTEDPKQPRLLSLSDFEWDPEGVDATCIAKARCERCPGEACRCGVWGFPDVRSLTSEIVRASRRLVWHDLVPYSPGVVGTVELWGRVIESASGWRAQKAKVTSFTPVCTECLQDRWIVRPVRAKVYEWTDELECPGRPAVPYCVEHQKTRYPGRSVRSLELVLKRLSDIYEAQLLDVDQLAWDAFDIHEPDAFFRFRFGRGEVPEHSRCILNGVALLEKKVPGWHRYFDLNDPGITSQSDVTRAIFGDLNDGLRRLGLKPEGGQGLGYGLGPGYKWMTHSVPFQLWNDAILWRHLIDQGMDPRSSERVTEYA